MDTLRDGHWLTPARLQAYAWMLLAGYVALFAWLLATSSGNLDAYGRPIGTDFANVWSAGKLALEGRPEVAFDPYQQRPYQHALLGTASPYFYGWHYPPMFLAVAALLATLPYLSALLVWVASTTALYLVTVRRIVAGTAEPTHLAALLALAYPAVFANATHGHNGCLTAALLGYGLVVLETRPLLAGVLFGLVAYKPQYGLLLPIALLAGGHWRTIASAAATLALTALASAALFGIESWQAFVAFSGFTREIVLEGGAPGWFKLQGVFPAVRMLGGSAALAYAAQSAVIVAMIVVIAWLWRSEASRATRAAGLLVASVLATPYAFNYDMVVLGPAIAFLAVEGLKRGFISYEKSLLALLWLTPLFSRELTQLTTIPVALVVQVSVLAMIARRAREETASAGAVAHA